MKAIYTGTHYQAIAKTGEAKGQLIDQYVYILDGLTDLELEKYKEKAGVYFKTDLDTGKPLFWSQEPFGDIAEMRFSKKGNLNPISDDNVANLRAQMKKHKDTPAEGIFAKMYAEAVLKATSVTSKQRNVPATPATPDKSAKKEKALGQA